MGTKDEIREERGRRIAAAGGIKPNGHLWLVPSQSHVGTYVVDPEAPGWSCTCPDAAKVARCKHSFAVQFFLSRTTNADGSVTDAAIVVVPAGAEPKYPRDWPVYRQAREAEARNVELLLASLCETIQQPPYVKGRPPAPFGEIVAGCTMKVFSMVASDRAMHHIDRLAHEQGVGAWDPNTYLKYMVDPRLMVHLEAAISTSALPFVPLETEFAADGTGISSRVWDRWFDEKWGEDGDGPNEDTTLDRKARRERDKRRKHMWVGLHVMSGRRSRVVTGVRVRRGHEHDSPQFAYLLDQTGKAFRIDKVALDKGYHSKQNVVGVAELGAVPFIPPKINSSPRGKHLYNRLIGWALNHPEAFDAEYYDGREHVEGTFHMIKAKFGGHVRSRNPIAQVNEVLCKVLCHNLCRVSEFMVRQILPREINDDFWARVAPPSREAEPLRLVEDDAARAAHPLLGNGGSGAGGAP